MLKSRTRSCITFTFIFYFRIFSFPKGCLGGILGYRTFSIELYKNKVIE
jgi:hypothetical protein